MTAIAKLRGLFGQGAERESRPYECAACGARFELRRQACPECGGCRIDRAEWL